MNTTIQNNNFYYQSTCKSFPYLIYRLMNAVITVIQMIYSIYLFDHGRGIRYYPVYYANWCVLLNTVVSIVDAVHVFRLYFQKNGEYEKGNVIMRKKIILNLMFYF